MDVSPRDVEWGPLCRRSMHDALHEKAFSLLDGARVADGHDLPRIAQVPLPQTQPMLERLKACARTHDEDVSRLDRALSTIAWHRFGVVSRQTRNALWGLATKRRHTVVLVDVLWPARHVYGAVVGLAPLKPFCA
eukprot:scaffold7446_cov403-Prasinococcus_capsulatus_cf.AAC.15